MRVFSKILAAIVMGLLAMVPVSTLAANFVDSGNSNYIFLGIGLVVLVAIAFAPTGRRAWGRGSLIAGALFVAAPLFMTALSAKVGSEMVSQSSASDAGATAVGAAIGGGLMVGATMFVGFVLGGILLVMGLVLVLGGRREVIVVNE